MVNNGCGNAEPYQKVFSQASLFVRKDAKSTLARIVVVADWLNWRDDHRFCIFVGITIECGSVNITQYKV